MNYLDKMDLIVGFWDCFEVRIASLSVLWDKFENLGVLAADSNYNLVKLGFTLKDTSECTLKLGVP
jgi:hypothetical protein